MKPSHVIFFALSLALFGFVAVPGRLKRAFEALEVYDYFKAKDLFYKSMKRDSVPAAYGLGIIYGRNDNPFFHPDSAFKFAGIASRRFPALDAGARIDYAPYGVDSLSIDKLVHRADSLVYSDVVKENDLDAFARFIDRAHTAQYRSIATTTRDSLAFEMAERLNSSQAYWDFIQKYPDAAQRDEAYKHYYRKFYREQTAAETMDAYRRFVIEYPDNPYRSDAEYRVYQMSTASDTPEAYAEFILDNPLNEHVDEAWRKLYLIEVGDMSPESIAAFSLKYPNYPHPEQLKRDFENATTRFYPYEQDGKWGYIDESGEIRIEPVYDWNEPFYEGLAIVGKNDKAGFVDKTGKLIAPIAYEEAFPLRNGYAVVEKDGMYGAINRAGSWALNPIYEDLGEYSDGYFFASKDGKYGYVDERGRTVIDFIYDDATDFKDGRAVVDSDGMKGLIDREGNPLTDFRYDWIERFPPGHLPARVRIDGRFGLIDRMGATVSEAKYAAIGDFDDGLALATDGDTYGFITTRGDTAIKFSYTYRPGALARSRFMDGFAPVYQKDLMGIIDTTGNKIFPAIFEDVGLYQGRLIPVKKRGKWGYANLAIDLAIPYRYSAAENFHDSLAIAAIDGRYGVIDTTGKPVIEFMYKRLNFIDTLVLAVDTAHGLLDIRGRVLVPLIYKSADQVDGRIIRFTDAKGRPRYFDYRTKAFLRAEDQKPIAPNE